jgi:hypothetical protein
MVEEMCQQRSRIEEMLEIVEDEQKMAIMKERVQSGRKGQF